jgi:hypothetical protein
MPDRGSDRQVGIDFDGAKVEAIQTVNEPTARANVRQRIVSGVLSALPTRTRTYTRRK